MTSQYSQIVDTDGIEKFVEPEVLEVVHLPLEKGVVDTEEICIEVNYQKEILTEMKKKRLDNEKNFGASFIYDVKEKEIKLAIIRLYGLIYKRFKEEANRLGRTMKIGDVIQVVEIPVSYLDLYPGEAAIHFKVFTKRKLVAVEAKNDNGLH